MFMYSVLRGSWRAKKQPHLFQKVFSVTVDTVSVSSLMSLGCFMLKMPLGAIPIAAGVSAVPCVVLSSMVWIIACFPSSSADLREAGEWNDFCNWWPCCPQDDELDETSHLFVEIEQEEKSETEDEAPGCCQGLFGLFTQKKSPPALGSAQNSVFDADYPPGETLHL